MKLGNTFTRHHLITHTNFFWNTGSSSAGPPEEYIARLDVEIDSARQGWFEINQNHVQTTLMIFKICLFSESILIEVIQFI